MDTRATVHPTDQILQSYGRGKLDDRLAQEVRQHLEECALCRSRIAELSSDTSLGRLREAQAKTAAAPAGAPMREMRNASADPPPMLPAAAGTLPPWLAEHPDYEILSELGRGEMGIVYLARNKLMDRKQVLKVVSSQLLERTGLLERFLCEIRSAALLLHPNIVTAYAATRVGESIVFSMEYVDGYDLAKVVEKNGPLSVAQASNFAYQAALGLQHAHEHRMVHQDIKPSNLIVTREGNKPVVKILDFGLAKVTSKGGIDTGLAHESQLLGTPHYVAPEQTTSPRNADIRADIYSLGCTLYCLLAGHPPFDAPSLYEILQAHHSMDAKPLNFVRPEVPVELAAVVAKMLAKEPQRRFQTPAEVARALAPFFKKAVASAGAKTTASQRGHRGIEQQPSDSKRASTQPDVASPSHPASRPKPAGSRTPADPKWESLIRLDDDDESEPVESTAAPIVPPRPLWLAPAGVLGLLLAGCIILWTVLTPQTTTQNGVVELSGLPDQAEVFLDDRKVMVYFPDDGPPAEISVPTGEHDIRIRKRGFRTSSAHVTLAAGGRAQISAKLVPLPGGSANPSP
jgi:serine/threonine protein kinase